jgi:serine/tyrosine/threonine adenylyltransferase
MSIFAHSQFTNSFARLPEDFYSLVQPARIEAAQWVSVNPAAAELIGLPESALNSAEFLSLMACTSLPEQSQPLASVYSGHQFGSYNPKLGDGRALLLGEITHLDKKWELQLKGSGLTPYSRMGDGRAVLRSSIREYLASESMHGLGIPTTRALAIVTSQTPVYRESVESAATILRMAPSHIRFGHFEYFFYTGQHPLLKQLADFVITHHYPEFSGLPETEKYARWFDEITQRTARLMAQWQSVGFCHGVMNTDNMSILGLTIDYGPFAFMDDFNPQFICNHSDDGGRYAYNQQVNIGLWNLNALAHALSPLIAVDNLKDSLMRYEWHFMANFRQLMRAKLGLQTPQDNDDEIIGGILELLAKERRDYTFFFRQLSFHREESLSVARDLFIDREAFDAWFASYQQRLQQENSIDEQRQQLMKNTNPKFVLRNYLAQQAIEQSQQGNHQMVNDLLTVLQNPYAEHEQFEHFAALPPDWGKTLEISCSS